MWNPGILLCEIVDISMFQFYFYISGQAMVAKKFKYVLLELDNDPIERPR